MRNRKIILVGGIAKRLLNRGHYLCDLKPKRENPSESCFVFYTDKWLQEDIDDIMQHPNTLDTKVIQQRVTALCMSEEDYRKEILLSYLKAVEYV